jgi:hypothetical protein
MTSILVGRHDLWSLRGSNPDQGARPTQPHPLWSDPPLLKEPFGAGQRNCLHVHLGRVGRSLWIGIDSLQWRPVHTAARFQEVMYGPFHSKIEHCRDSHRWLVSELYCATHVHTLRAPPCLALRISVQRLGKC